LDNEGILVMKKFFIIFLVFFFFNNLFAEEFLRGLKMGMSSKEIKSIGKDISNPNSWEETEFEISNPESIFLFEKKPKKAILTFYNDRLFKVNLIFNRDEFNSLYDVISQKFSKPNPKDEALNQKDRESKWYGDFKDNKFTYIINLYEFYEDTKFVYQDQTQTNFHFTDLFRGVLIWIFITIAGMFIVYLMFGYFITSYCPNCKSFSLKLEGKSFTNPNDYDPSLFSQDVRWDEIYHFKCHNCGFEKDDVYSGFWFHGS